MGFWLFLRKGLIYNVGEKYTADLWIQQGGLKSTASVVSFSVDKALLDSMNIADGTSYELLPADCYQLTKSSVDIPANERLLKGRYLRQAALTSFPDYRL